MVSGVSFNNPASPKAKKKKKSLASTGLVIVFLLLVLVIAAYGILFLINGGLSNKITSLDQGITQQQNEIDEAVKSVAGTVTKKIEIEKKAYAGIPTDVILTQFQDMMVPRIVLKTFEHSYIVSDSIHRINLTADADNFDVVAAQVKIWKESPLFARVTVGESDRDDEGRIVFSMEFDLADDVDRDSLVKKAVNPGLANSVVPRNQAAQNSEDESVTPGNAEVGGNDTEGTEENAVDSADENTEETVQ